MYLLSQREDDAKRVGDNRWLDFLAGKNADYPEQALIGALEQVRRAFDRHAAEHVLARVVDLRVELDAAALFDQRLDLVAVIVAIDLVDLCRDAQLHAGALPWWFVVGWAASLLDAFLTAALAVNNAAQKPFFSKQAAN